MYNLEYGAVVLLATKQNNLLKFAILTRAEHAQQRQRMKPKATDTRRAHAFGLTSNR